MIEYHCRSGVKADELGSKHERDSCHLSISIYSMVLLVAASVARCLAGSRRGAA